MLSPSSRSPPSSSVFEKKTPPHLRRLAKPTSGGQEPEKGQPACQVLARDQCVVKSLQMRRFTKGGKSLLGEVPHDRGATRGQSVRKFYCPRISCCRAAATPGFNYEAEMSHLRMRRWSVER